jgi:hypothetical protein
MSALIGGRRESSTLDSEIFPQFTGVSEQFRVLDSTPGAALRLGVTRSKRPVNITLLRPEASQVVVVGRPWLATMLALRAAILGANVIIVSDRPAPWNQLVHTVGGRLPFATVVRPGDSIGAPATVAAPVLVLYDGQFTGPEPARSPWQTALHLVLRLNSQVSGLLDTSDLVLVAPPDPAEAEATVDLLRLPASVLATFERMTANEFLAITRARALLVSIEPTPTEGALISGR